MTNHYFTSLVLSFKQIIEDVQNFYAKTYNENNNGTLITSYQQVVSQK